MAKATIKSKNGTQIYVEGTPEEVSKIIKDVKSREEKLEAIRSARISRKITATDAILNLKKENFFNEPKTLSNIKERLAENGLIYPVTSLSGILIGLVKKRELGRIKTGKIWGYVNR